ncbi:hypothetical protein KEM52_006578 [Ascosphaera acerosa]|nr:hypothetical protein KEM52_006578 [Ascosphaera acerosa]
MRSHSPFLSGDNSDMAGWSSQPGVKGALARYMERSYMLDYICLACTMAGWVLVQLFATPMHRMFRLDDITIQFPFAEDERVPTYMSIVYAGVIPFAIIMVWCATLRQSSHFTHVALLGFLTTVWLTSLVTDIMKNAFGRPRPDLISRCQPELGTPMHEWVTWRVCTQKSNHKLQEGWRSFPSGHSSFAWAGCGYLAFFLASQTHAFNSRGTITSICLAVSPFFASLIIACSRVADYRHDIYDVSAGTILGLCIAYLTFRHYFPHFGHPQCHIPFERSTHAEASGFRRVANDDEEAVNGYAQDNTALSPDNGAESSPYPSSFALRPRAA